MIFFNYATQPAYWAARNEPPGDVKFAYFYNGRHLDRNPAYFGMEWRDLIQHNKAVSNNKYYNYNSVVILQAPNCQCPAFMYSGIGNNMTAAFALKAGLRKA